MDGSTQPTHEVDRASLPEIWKRLRLAASDHAEDFVAELPLLLRRLRTLLLVVCISIPVFLLAVFWLLWHLLT